MVKNYASLFLLLLIAAFAEVNAQDAPVLTFNIPAQNNVKFNRFLLNPSFSFVRESNTYISLYHRNQWVQFDDSPKVYMLTYTGKFSDRSGLGFGIYQQNLGVISSFGGIANYSYNVPLKEEMDLTIGFNFAYYNSGIDKDRAITGEPDPVIMAMRNNSLLSIKPGINFGYKNFDFGVYAENLIEYDFKSNEMVKDYSDKTYSALVMYTHKMVAAKDLFEDSEFRLALGGRTSQERGFGLNGSVLVDFPKMGWFQAGMDDYYGVGIGAGFHFTKRLSLGYTYERTVKAGLVNLGPTHEITMVFAIKDRMAMLQRSKTAQDSLRAALNEIEDEEAGVAETSQSAKKAVADYDRKAELEKLRLDLDQESQHLLDVLVREDSLNNVKKKEFDQKVKNLKEYARREKEAREAQQEQPLVLKNLSADSETVVPKTIEDLKKAESGYYVVSKSTDGKETPEIVRYGTFTEALNASDKKKTSGKAKDVHVIHVDNAPAEDIKPDVQPEGEAQAADKKGNTLKTEEEIKQFYSAKTSKPRETLQKVNKLSVEGMDAGYYIIANVFSGEDNTQSFIDTLRNRGIEADYFINPKNNFRYVYLKKHSTWKEALISYYSNVNNKYFDPIWIMSINTN